MSNNAKIQTAKKRTTKPAEYPVPVSTRKCADSVYIERWGKYSDDRQITCYRGLPDDLVAVGIVPQRMFDETGKSGVKSARVIGLDGNKRPIRIKKAGRGTWRVEIEHNPGKLPYMSAKARCIQENSDERWRAARRTTKRNPFVNGNVIEASLLFRGNSRSSQINKGDQPKERDDRDTLVKLFALVKELQDEDTRDFVLVALRDAALAYVSKIW